MTTLPQLITRAEGVLDEIDNLLAEDYATTLVNDPTSGYPVSQVSYDAASKDWIITQNTADTDGKFRTRLTLPDSSICSVLEVVSVDAHSNPLDSSAPARYKACGASR